MPFAITHRLSNGDTTDGTSFTTASVSVTAGDLLFAVVTNGYSTTSPEAPTSITGTLGTTLTFTQRVTELMNSSLRARTTITTAPCAATTSGTLTFNFTNTMAHVQWTMFTLTGADNSAPVVRTQTAQMNTINPSLTLSPAPGATSAVVAAMHGNTSSAITAGSGYALIGTGTYQSGSPATLQATEYDLTTPSATVGFTQATAAINRALLAVEVREAPVPRRTLVAPPLQVSQSFTR